MSEPGYVYVGQTGPDKIGHVIGWGGCQRQKCEISYKISRTAYGVGYNPYRATGLRWAWEATLDPGPSITVDIHGEKGGCLFKSKHHRDSAKFLNV